MDNPKIRRLLILLHLYGAALMAPAFVLVAYTGALHMIGGVESETSQPIALPAGTQIDFKSPTAKDDVKALLKSVNVDHDFEYIKDRGSSAQTRPTSRPYVSFKKTDTGWTATKQTPNLQKSLMEIHKGHGPKIMRTYHKLVGFTLILIVFGGILIGLLAKAYRKKTIIASIIGMVVYFGLILFG